MTTNKHSATIIVYFALLAIAVGLCSAVGIRPSMPMLLASMAVAALLLFLVKVTFSFIKRKMEHFGLNRKQFAMALAGIDPSRAQVVESVPPGERTDRSLVTAQSTHPVLYDPHFDEEGELPDAFIEPDGLLLSSTFQPSVHDFLGQMVSVFGIRRMGKSNCVTLLIETLASHGLPMLICDTKDEYAGLVNPKYLPHGYMAGAPRMTANIPSTVRQYYIPLDEDGAHGFGKAIMEGLFQVVLNLKSYETDDEAARVMCGVIRGINAWEEERPNSKRVPVEIVLDEGHKWLPQNESSEVSKETRDLLHKTFFSIIVRLGGFNGFGFIVASQRNSELDKRCLQSTWKFLFKQTESIDLKKYREWNLDQEDILSLHPGECFVFSPHVLGFRTSLYRKQSPDFSMTPTLEQLNQHKQVAMARHDMLAHRRSYTRTMEVDTSAPIQEEQRVITEDLPVVPQKSVVVESVPLPENQLTPEQKAVLGQWHRGRKTHRQIAAALKVTAPHLNVSEDRALKVLNQLEVMGYITLVHRK